MSGLTRREFTRRFFALVSLAAGGRAGSVNAPPRAVTRRSVTSADGTGIGYAQLGDGPAIVFSHESLESGAEWLVLAGLLADRYRCFVVDRRGRGSSGPPGYHSLARECEDLEAVLAEAGPGATLMGASYGAIVALETALRFGVERLIIYEPPLVLGDSSPIHRALEDSFETYRQLVESGSLDEALAYGLEKFAAVPADAVLEIRTGSPEAWAVMRDLTPTWVPEMRAIRALPMGIDRYRRLQMPTLLVTGSESPGFLRDVVAVLHEELPDSSMLVLDGQGHEAHLTAPAMLQEGITRFLSVRAASAQPRIASRR